MWPFFTYFWGNNPHLHQRDTNSWASASTGTFKNIYICKLLQLGSDYVAWMILLPRPWRNGAGCLHINSNEVSGKKETSHRSCRTHRVGAVTHRQSMDVSSHWSVWWIGIHTLLLNSVVELNRQGFFDSSYDLFSNILMTCCLEKRLLFLVGWVMRVATNPWLPPGIGPSWLNKVSLYIYIWYIVVTSFQKTTWLCWTCVVQTSVSKSKFPTTNLHGLLYALFLGAPHSPEVSSHLVGRRLDHRLKRDPFTWLEKKTNTLCCSNILFWGKILLKSVSQWFFRILAYFVCNFKNKPRT